MQHPDEARVTDLRDRIDRREYRVDPDAVARVIVQRLIAGQRKCS